MLVAALALTACGSPEPTGQVIARLDGSDITRRDLLVELQATAGGLDADLATAEPALLRRVADRRLLAAEARRRRIDRSPEYLGLERRAREELLVALLDRRTPRGRSALLARLRYGATIRCRADVSCVRAISP